MTPPHPPISDGNKDDTSGLVKAETDRVLSEMSKNHTMGGGVGVSDRYFLYNPHNYRLYLPFSRVGLQVNHTLECGFIKVNSGSELVGVWGGCGIRVKRRLVEVLVSGERWYRIPLKGSRKGVFEALVGLNGVGLAALRGFMKKFGGSSDFRIVSMKCENKVMHEDVIDTLPLRLRFQDDVVKKVYDEALVEFSDPVFAVNYFSNRAIEEIAPEIAKELASIRLGLADKVGLVKGGVVVLDDIFEFGGVIGSMSLGDRQEVTDWLFEKFGG